MLTAAALLMAALFITAGVMVIYHFGALWGGWLMNGFKMIESGLVIIVEVVASALDQ